MTFRLVAVAWTGVLIAALVAGCAALPPPTASREPLLRDALFPAAPAVPGASAIFALSDAMRAHADAELQRTRRRPDPRRALIDALYADGGLRLRYDMARTRSAAEAFDARSGNCLSLVVMTAAFARHLGLPVGYQQVLVDEQVTRSGDLTVVSGHVNLVLARPGPTAPRDALQGDVLTVDFLPQRDVAGYRTVPLSEATIVAMFMNNRAAEALGGGRLDEAYAWAAAAVRHDAAFVAAVNTLAVVYLRAGHLAPAEAALRALLDDDPRHVTALANLAQVLRQDGRDAAARDVERRLAALQPLPPFQALDAGRAAMRSGDWQQARELFARELRRDPRLHEAHHGAADAAWRLGDRAAAVEHLRQAIANSPDDARHAGYAAKLDRLRAAPPAR